MNGFRENELAELQSESTKQTLNNPRAMRALHPALKTLHVFLCLGVAVVCLSVWVHDSSIVRRLATLRLGEHEVRLKIGYSLDFGKPAHTVYCWLRGPRRKHSAETIAYIGVGTSPPSFTVHQATNQQ